MCFYRLFYLSKGITSVSEDFLPATTLTAYCYYGMFSGCSSLSIVKIAYKGNYDESYFGDWVTGVYRTGTFYYKGGDLYANFGFPDGWTKNNISN